MSAPELAALVAVPGPLDETVAALPGAPGLHAWWAPPHAVPALGGAGHPAVPGLRLLDLRAATMLRNRIRRQDLYRTGVSRLRRVLSGLLLDELGLAPTWAADVVLPRADEERLTAWMTEHLRLTWCPTAERTASAEPARAALGAPGTDDDAARDAEARYVAAAGEKVAPPPGVPFRRP